MNRFYRTVFAALLAAPPIVMGQAGNPAGAAPDTPGVETGHPSALRANDADKLFAKEVSLGGMAEVDMGKLGTQRASNAGVKDFARRMVNDHGRANNQFTSVAKGSGVALRTDWDMDHSVVRAQLDRLNGAAFDSAYVRAQIEEHQRTALLLEWEIGSGEEPAIKQYAMNLLPMVLDHLETAQKLLAEMTGAGTRM